MLLRKAADRLGYNPPAIRRAVGEGRMRGHKRGKHLWIPLAEVERVEQERREDAARRAGKTTTAAAAMRLGVDSQSVRKAIHRGLLACELIDGSYWIARGEVERYARERVTA